MGIFSFRKSIIIYSLLLALLTWVSTLEGVAQGHRHVIQFSGFVLGGQDGKPLEGANLYSPAGRGTNTNAYGFFSMPTLAGDSIIISAVGFKKRFYVMPRIPDEGYSVIIELMSDTTELPVVEVFPYPSEELFKEAFLALELPDEKDRQAVAKNLNQQLLSQMAFAAGMTPNQNFRNFSQQQASGQTSRYFNPTYQFLNPFKWAEFIKSIKRGDLKKKPSY